MLTSPPLCTNGSPELENRVDRGRRPRLVLRRILGLGFGLAMVFGGTVGVGILRLPGTVAAALGDTKLIVMFWILGGAYALLGAVSVSELAAMLPQAGGFYVYARRAFGNGVGLPTRPGGKSKRRSFANAGVNGPVFPFLSGPRLPLNARVLVNWKG